MIIFLDDSGGGPPPVPSTFDATLKGASIVLSNGDLDATKAGTGYQTVYGVQGRGSGRYAFELLVTALPVSSVMLGGIADKTNSGNVISTYLGNNGAVVDESFGWNDSPARYYRRMSIGNVNAGGAGFGYSLGNVLTFDVNISAGTITLYRNGVPTGLGSISITSGKTYFPAVSLQSGAAARLITTGLTYLPSGASEWG